MSVAYNTILTELDQPGDTLPIVIIGNGPVGVRVAQTLLRENPGQAIVIYGNEPWEPYNRVQLSAFLAGELDWLGLTGSQRIPELPHVTQIHNCEVVFINRRQRLVIDALERIQPYRKLIIATGSRPHVPDIPGKDNEHVYRFRSLSDVEQLAARRVRSRRTVVMGGGLLGLEAARAMQRQHTEVIVVDHAHYLLSQQLDELSAELLREHVLSIGIKVQLGQGVAEILGDGKVSGVKFRNGQVIECDTVIIATGIKPNIELARNAHLRIGRGIRVNDRMQTSDPHIYAVGECAEHRGTVYGLVAPGYEQAGVVVHSVLDRPSHYHGSITATKLKVVGKPAFSMGQANVEDDPGRFYQAHVYHHPEKGLYRKLVVKNGRLVGSIAIGQWEELGRIQESVCKQRRLWPWQLRRFMHTGMVWGTQQTSQIAQWPASTTICQCMGVSRGQMSKAINGGHHTLEALRDATGASSVCGGCKPLLANLLGSKTQADRIGAFKTVLLLSVLAVLVSGLISAASPIPFQDSVMTGWSFDVLWRDGFLKQFSGYTILGMALLGLILSLRKRLKLFRWLEFSHWRLLHVVTGVLVVAGLIAHTGLRFGDNLNRYLMMDFIALLAIGGMAGTILAVQHKLDAARALKWKNLLLWGHILLVWPLPVLLAFHILQTYYF